MRWLCFTAASAVAGKWVTNQVLESGSVSEFAFATVADGTVSVIGGGKFENDAATAAIGDLYKACREGVASSVELPVRENSTSDFPGF